MKLAIMQPYFLPYVGYFQLLAAVDQFIVYDNIQYTKKGWINRNRLLQNGKDVLFSLPLKKDSDFLDVCARELAPDFKRAKLLQQFKGAYRKAPYYHETLPVLERILNYEDNNLFGFIHHSLIMLCQHLGIQTQILISSEINIDHDLKGQEKVLALCSACKADVYINAIGGKELYSKDIFKSQGLELQFIQAKPFEYAQFDHPFVPWLSILDVMMFNPMPTIQTCLTTHYDLS